MVGFASLPTKFIATKFYCRHTQKHGIDAAQSWCSYWMVMLVHPIAAEVAGHLRFINRDIFFMRMMER
jgi:hypothetical protein